MSRDGVLRQFEKLARYHRATDHWCICGEYTCETLPIVGLTTSLAGCIDETRRGNSHTRNP
jgi:hypothetical protein